MSLMELAERCKKADGPTRHLDNSIRLALNGGRAFGTDPAYTASLDAAMTLVPEGWTFNVSRQFDDDGEFWCAATLTNSFTGYDDEDPLLTATVSGCRTPALALCAAALRARVERQSMGRVGL